ncbi:MAG: hypothetical protein KF791_13090 [Verrucomicrobiae bacterium]|nr:hypothetical protein [Verrucomicrobiae bacterium]
MTRQIDFIGEWLKRGADINARRSDGGRPIHLTNGDSHFRGWRDVPDDPPWATPLAWATRCGHRDIAEILKRHGAN